jgi:GDP-D-mannose dehydratase
VFVFVGEIPFTIIFLSFNSSAQLSVKLFSAAFVQQYADQFSLIFFAEGDATKAETELGWTREYDLDKLIDDMMK